MSNVVKVLAKNVCIPLHYVIDTMVSTALRQRLRFLSEGKLTYPTAWAMGEEGKVVSFLKIFTDRTFAGHLLRSRFQSLANKFIHSLEKHSELFKLQKDLHNPIKKRGKEEGQNYKKQYGNENGMKQLQTKNLLRESISQCS